MHTNRESPVADHHKDPKKPDAGAVLACVAGSGRAAQPGVPHRPLRGQNLGLLCGGDGRAQNIEAFRDAAAELGAHVAIIRSDLTSASTTQTIGETARLLSRLYDAVECDGLPEAVVDELARVATIPVSSGHIALAEQVDMLAHQLEGPDAWEQKRRSLLQALVMQSVCRP